MKSKDYFEFTVPGRPKGKERPRFSGGCVYTPRATRDYERLITACAKSAMRAEGVREWLNSPDTEVGVYINAYFPVPKSWPKWMQEKARQGKIRPTCKPDNDNVKKAVFDALNHVAYRDDHQVVSDGMEKWYIPDPAAPHKAGWLDVAVVITRKRTRREDFADE